MISKRSIETFEDPNVDSCTVKVTIIAVWVSYLRGSTLRTFHLLNRRKKKDKKSMCIEKKTNRSTLYDFSNEPRNLIEVYISDDKSHVFQDRQII